MKKIITIAAMLLLASVSFPAVAGSNFIVKGGVGISSMTLDGAGVPQLGENDLFHNYTGFHAGIGYQTSSLLGLSLQPELLFSRQGAKVGEDGAMKLDYLQVPVNLQWGPNLMVIRPYVQVSPFVGYCLSGKFSLPELGSDISNDLSKFNYGLGIGAGLELLDRIQISAKYCWGFGQIEQWSSLVKLDNWLDNAKNVKTRTGVMEISFALQF